MPPVPSRPSPWSPPIRRGSSACSGSITFLPGIRRAPVVRAGQDHARPEMSALCIRVFPYGPVDFAGSRVSVSVRGTGRKDIVMGERFEVTWEGELPASPRSVWEAFTEHTGGWLWEISYEPRRGGA